MITIQNKCDTRKTVTNTPIFELQAIYTEMT